MSRYGGSTSHRAEASPAIGSDSQGGQSGAEAVDPSQRNSGYRKTRLMQNPDNNHEPETYEDLQLEFSPSFFSSMERHLPQDLRRAPRDVKIKFMHEILRDFVPPGLVNRVCFNVPLVTCF